MTDPTPAQLKAEMEAAEVFRKAEAAAHKALLVAIDAAHASAEAAYHKALEAQEKSND
jgi:hypothetical protein